MLPQALVLTDGNVPEMIANCDMLVAQRSAVVYTGIALGKEMHAELAMSELQSLMPVQNNDQSAQRIAQISAQLIDMSSAQLAIYRMKGLLRGKWRFFGQPTNRIGL